jgi:fibronectin-binding autotransporter adhesin
MKPKFRTNPILAGSVALVVTVSALHAGDGTWIATAAGPHNWSDDTKWLDTDEDTIGDVADGTGFTAFFTPNITANQTVTVDSARTIGNITFTDSTTSSHNLTISGANALTLDVSTGVSVIDVTQTGRSLTISAPVTVNDGLQKNGLGTLTFGGPITLAGPQTWTNNSTGSVTTGNGTNLITNGGHQLTVTGTGVTNLGTVATAPVVLSGSGALVKSGSGRLNVGGLNTGFTGAVTINGGVLHAYNDAGALGNGNVTLSGGVLSFYWSVNYTRTLGDAINQVQILGGESGFAGSGTTGPTINLGTTVRWGAAGEGALDEEDSGATGFFNPSKFVLGDAGTSNAALTTFSSGIDLNGTTRTIVVPYGVSAAGNRSTISGAISSSSGTAGLTKEGNGWLFLTAAPTYSGTTTVSGGMLDLAALNLNSMGGGAEVRSISVAAGAGVRRNNLDNAFLKRLVETPDEIIVMTGGTSNALDFSSDTGATLPNAFLSNWAGNGAKAELSGVITPGGGAYRLGSLRQSGALGIRQESLLSGDNQLIIGGNRVVIVGAHTFTGDTTIRNGGRLGLSAAGTAEAPNTHSLALQNSALDLGETSATGQFFLEASTTAGPITGSNPSSVGGTQSATFGGLKGSRNLFSAYIAGNTGNNTAGAAVTNITGFTLNVGTGKTHTYSGVIGGFGAGAASGTGGAMTLTKTGEGTQVLEGTHTYTGATTISGGTLSLGASGSIASSASLTIDAGGTLDTSGQASHAIQASQPLTFGLDATSSGKITAGELNIENAAVSFTGTTGAAVYVLANYTSLIGTSFASVTLPSGYTLDYAYGGNKIALVSTGGGLSAYATWASTNAPGSGPNDDYDGDGVSNAVEFVLGGSAATNDLGKLPAVSASGGNMTFSFVRDQASIEATTAMSIEVGTDLASWPDSYIVPDGAAENVPGVTVVKNSPSGFDTVTLTVPQSPDAKKFARLKVVISE